jgi:pyruvate dehydrogenase (quinone)
LPDENALREAAAILNEGKKVLILAGRGAIGAGDLLEQFAEKLGAAIAKPLLGKMCVPDDSPYCTGSVGLLGTEPSHLALRDCDTLFIVGSSFPYIEFYPGLGQAKCVQLDCDPARIGLRYPADIGLVGDTRQTLAELFPLLRQREDRGFLEKIQDSKKKWMKLMDVRGTVKDTPMKPQVVAWELNKLLRDDAIILSDSGTIATWYARHIHIRKRQMCTLSGNLATMACGLPYSIGAQVAYPERQVVALVGDGGFTMLMAEMLTAKKYDLPVKIVVFKNNELGQIKWEQMVMLGNPEYVCDLQPLDFVKFAEACGVAAFRADDPRTCGSVLAEALSAPGPAVIEAVVDPHEPPLPAHIEFSQAKSFAESIIKGTPERGKILEAIAKDKVRELI